MKSKRSHCNPYLSVTTPVSTNAPVPILFSAETVAQLEAREAQERRAFFASLPPGEQLRLCNFFNMVFTNRETGEYIFTVKPAQSLAANAGASL